MFYWIKYLLLGANATAVCLNSVLCPIIYYRSGKQIGSYRYLLLCFAIFELIFSFSLLLTNTMMRSGDFGFLSYATLNLFTQEIGCWIITLRTFCFLSIIIILTYLFMYRYTVTCKQSLQIWFQEPVRIFILALIFVVIGFSFSIQSRINFFPSSEKTRRLEKALFDDKSIDITKTAYVLIKLNKRDGSYNVKAMVSIISWLIILATCISMDMAVIWRMRVAFKQSMKFTSRKTLQTQKRLFYLLILQTTVPFVCSFLPTFVTYGLMAFSIKTTVIPQFTPLGMPMIAIINPILIFLFVKEYREALLRCGRKKKNGIQTITVKSIASHS